MSINAIVLKKYLYPYILYVVVALSAVFGMNSWVWLLPILFLLLPFIDSSWKVPAIQRQKYLRIIWLILVLSILLLLLQHPEALDLFIVMVLLAALPEEWFFRAYLQARLGNNNAAVFIVSVLFSFMHFIAHDTMVVLLVFIPSLFFGWMYRKTNDLVLVVILHALSNLFYYIYLQAYIEDYFV